MARLSAFFAALVAASIVAASPVVEIRDSPLKMGFAVRVNATGGIKNFVQQEQERAQQLIQIGRERAARRVSGDKVKRAVVSVGVTNTAVSNRDCAPIINRGLTPEDRSLISPPSV